MRETIECLRPILRGERGNYDGRFVHCDGFRLRHPLQSRIGVGAFGPSMIKLSAQFADEIVLNLASPQRVSQVREQIEQHAAAAGRMPPHVTAWVPVAVRPGAAALRQLAGQLAVYLAPPGYGEMFCGLGFAGLVERARGGARRADLAAAIPLELAWQLAALGTPEQVADRIRTYLEAGADTVAVIPVTAEDPGGRIALGCAADILPHNLANSGDRLMTTANIQCRLAARPAEMLKASDWTIVEEPKPIAAAGAIRRSRRLPVDRPRDAHLDERRSQLRATGRDR